MDSKEIRYLKNITRVIAGDSEKKHTGTFFTSSVQDVRDYFITVYKSNSSKILQSVPKTNQQWLLDIEQCDETGVDFAQVYLISLKSENNNKVIFVYHYLLAIFLFLGEESKKKLLPTLRKYEAFLGMDKEKCATLTTATTATTSRSMTTGTEQPKQQKNQMEDFANQFKSMASNFFEMKDGNVEINGDQINSKINMITGMAKTMMKNTPFEIDEKVIDNGAKLITNIVSSQETKKLVNDLTKSFAGSGTDLSNLRETFTDADKMSTIVSGTINSMKQYSESISKNPEIAEEILKLNQDNLSKNICEQYNDNDIVDE